MCAELVGQMPATTDEMKKAIDFMRKKENAIVGEQVDETAGLNI